jgi:outer membrane protein assembly factor BamD (BamD/ComL family)
MKRTLLITISASLLLACGGGAEQAPDAKMLEARARIRHMEDSLFESQAFDLRSAQGMVDVYKGYASAYPADSLTPEYLFRAAGSLKSMNQADQSLLLYDRLIRDYPEWRRTVDVLYMKALTLDDELDRDGEAKVVYEQVINTFPDHPFARDARAMIENLGLTDEELIAKFKAMNEQAAEAQ